MLKKGYDSGKNIIIVIIKLYLDIHKIHLHTTHLTFQSQVIIQKPNFFKFEVQDSGKIVEKSLLSNYLLDIHTYILHLNINITERLLKVALNTITLTRSSGIRSTKSGITLVRIVEK